MATQLSAGEVLRLSADERARFVQQNLSDHTQDGSLNIQTSRAGKGYPKPRGLFLAENCCDQAVERVTAPSIDATALVALLHHIPSESEHRTMQSYYPSPSCGSTVEPPEDEDREHEIKCHQALLDDGCRPLFHVRLLPQIEANPDAYVHLLRPWASQKHPTDPREAWQALSKQWDRWKEFRVWQLRGRRRRPGFDEYLDAYRRDYFMSGGISSGTAEADFERVARLCWEDEYDYEDGEDVERHAERLGRRLVQQALVLRRPFSLLADPKGQDQWTTYVEYLAFEAESLYRLTGLAERLEKRVKTRDGYEGKVGWVLSEIEKIEAEQKAATGESGGSTSGSSRKRKHTYDTNRPGGVFAPRLGKRRRTKKVEEMDKTDETEKMPAGKSANSSQTRRSKRRKPSTEADEKEEEEEEDVPEPQSKRRKVVGTCDGPSSIPQAQALDPRAPAVSQIPPPGRRRRSKRLKAPLGTAAAAGAPPDARGERLRSLRPRVNGKAVTVSTDSRHGWGGEKN
ncbi:MAG: hypothetical protein Q9196_006414 [Gyalolechia fulgens]